VGVLCYEVDCDSLRAFQILGWVTPALLADHASQNIGHNRDLLKKCHEFMFCAFVSSRYAF
jgi:hypothetical protein